MVVRYEGLLLGYWLVGIFSKIGSELLIDEMEWNVFVDIDIELVSFSSYLDTFIF